MYRRDTMQLTLIIASLDRNSREARQAGQQMVRGPVVALPWMHRLNPTFGADGAANAVAIDIPHDPLDDAPDPFTPDEADQLTEMLGEDYVCPISRELCRHPVKAADGFTYDRKFIKDWMRIRLSSPMTNEPLANTDVVPDEEKEQGIARAVEKLRAQRDEKTTDSPVNGEPLAGLEIVTSRLDSIASPAATAPPGEPDSHGDDGWDGPIRSK